MTSTRGSGLTLRARLILMNALMIGLLGGAMISQQVSLVREQAAIEGLSAAQGRQKILVEIRNLFDDYRYWSMDMIVSSGSASAQAANDTRNALLEALKESSIKDQPWVSELKTHLAAITDHMLAIFDATEEKKAALRNSELEKCRARMAAAARPIAKAVNEQQSFAADASAKVLALARASARISLVVLLIAVPAGIFLAWLTLRSVTHPLRQLSSHLSLLATGDLTGDLMEKRSDEFGALLASLREMQSRMRETLLSMSGNAKTLVGSSDSLASVFQTLNQSAGETTSQAQMVQKTIEQISRDSQVVVSASDEMSKSIREVARNASRAAEVSASAVRLAEVANRSITHLGAESVEIGKVVKLINSIAEQTNLLALNASIEAARAGNVGHGFAIVAGEVKDLARKTSDATVEIRKKIETLQKSTSQAVDSIGQITRTIQEISATQSAIATAVDQQTVTTKEMNGMYTRTAQDNQKIARSASQVADAARGASTGAQETQKAAVRLSEIAQEQERLLHRFKC